MKKILISLGSIATVVAPITGVVSCKKATPKPTKSVKGQSKVDAKYDWIDPKAKGKKINKTITLDMRKSPDEADIEMKKIEALSIDNQGKLVYEILGINKDGSRHNFIATTLRGTKNPLEIWLETVDDE